MADKKVYTEEEKKNILARAEEIGVRKAAEEAGAAWQAVVQWKKSAARVFAAAVEDVKEEAGKVAEATEAEAEKVAEATEAEAEKVAEATEAEAEKAETKAKKTTAKAKEAAKKTSRKVKAAAKKAEKTARSTAEKIAEEAKAVQKKTEESFKKVSKGKKMIASLTIQSPLGGEITPDEIRAKVGDVDHIYVRVDHNKAYWVKGEETGSVDLW